ncbi:TPA: hypothetical protein ACOQVU_001835 [Acinetobacter baumannii]
MDQMLDLSIIDKLIDEELESVKLKKISLELAIWRFLTVAEDRVRCSYIDENMNFEEISFINFQMKFIYKFSIQKICRDMLKTNVKKINLKTNQLVYKEYSELISSSFNYVQKYNILSRLYDNYFDLSVNGNIVNCTYKQNAYLCEYSALELLGHGQSERDLFISAILSFYYLNKETSLKCFVFDKFESKVLLKNRSISYKFDSSFLNILNVAFGELKRKCVFNGNFIFKWGDSETTRKVIDAILTRCLSHLLIMWVAVKKYNFVGGFEDNLILQINKEMLVEEIALISNINNKNIIYEVINFLTYPINDPNADSALQPIFDFQGNLYLPCIHIIESNIERNIFTLYSRKETKEYDRGSKVFELSMIESIEKNLTNYNYKKNFEIRISKKTQEYDFILIDKINKFIMIVELRWMIQPADPREISRKINACREKLDKVKEKKEYMRNFKENFEKSLYLDNLDEYSIQGVIVIDGYGGEFSGDIDIPLTTMEIFNIALCSCKGLIEVYESIKSLKWLPRENEFFCKANEVVEIGHYTFNISGLSIINRNTNSYIKSLKLFFEKFEI